MGKGQGVLFMVGTVWLDRSHQLKDPMGQF